MVEVRGAQCLDRVAVLMAAAMKGMDGVGVCGARFAHTGRHEGQRARDCVKAGQAAGWGREVLEERKCAVADDFAAGVPLRIIRRVQRAKDRAPRASTSSDHPLDPC